MLWLAILFFGVSLNALTARELLIRSKIPIHREFPVDKKKDPCQDFHAYVCHKVEASLVLPKDRSRWIFSFTDSAERLLDARKEFFKKLNEGYEPKFERTKNVQRLYRSCMDAEGAKRGETRYVKSTIKKIMALSDGEAVRKFVQGRYNTPEFSFLEYWKEPNLDDPDRFDLVLANSGLSLPEKTIYEEKAAVADVEKLAAAFFSELKLENPKERAAAVVRFETGLAKVYPSSTDFRRISSEHNTVSRLNLTQNFPNLNLENIYGRLPSRVGIRNWTIDGFYYLNTYLATAPVEDVKSVLLYHSLKDFMDDGYPDFFKFYFQFQHKHLGGPEARPKRNERCTKLVMNFLDMELDAELLDILFPKTEEEAIQKLVDKIRQSILSGLKKNSWLSENAKKEALRKMKDARLMLVKPDSEKDWNFLDLVALTDDNPIENVLTIQRAQNARLFKEIREKRNRNEWSMSPLTVNAQYQPPDNTFVLPQGILQYPFYDAKQTDDENLASMGTVVGHELGHGIDDQGAKYDHEGVLKNWMSDKDLKTFADIGKRFAENFDKAGINGQLTMGENIGDNVGLQASLEAAFPDLESVTVEQAQKFFESYGRLWCGKATPEARKVLLKNDPHSPFEARINLQVKHKDLFYKAYACKEGDAMYLKPEDRIRVW